MESDEILQVNVDFGNNLYYDTNLPCTLYLDDRDIMNDNDRKITALLVSPEAIIVITDPPETKIPGWDAPRTKCVNNVFAFDSDGNKIWDFETLFGKEHYPILLGSFLNKTEKDFYAKYFHLPIVDSHRYFVASTFADEHYFIDVTERKYIGRAAHR